MSGVNLGHTSLAALRLTLHESKPSGETDFTCLKVFGSGWFYLSTILDDHSRYIVAWNLATKMKSGDVIDKLELALQASGRAKATMLH